MICFGIRHTGIQADNLCPKAGNEIMHRQRQQTWWLWICDSNKFVFQTTQRKATVVLSETDQQ